MPSVKIKLAFPQGLNQELSDYRRAVGVVVSHPLRMRKALGSNPSVLVCLLAVSPPRVRHEGYS